jgi:hypothetical protein
VSRVDDLLAAPRGRGLCAALRWTEGDVFDALVRCVDNAAYWQEPLDADEIDAPDADERLWPLAEQIVHSDDIDWWRSPVALDDQWYVDLLHGNERARPPALTGAGTALARWRVDERQSTRRAQHIPADVDVESVSGTWWSAPISRGVPTTTRSLAGRGPAGLWLVEDEMGWRRACCTPLAPARSPRVYEVHGPDDWSALAGRYPLEVTDSRSPDWRRATGRVGRWTIPDWAAVAVDWDAVHVSVWGYLTTAGRPLPVGGGTASVLAGWAPDQTYWLTDCLQTSGEPVDYRKDEDDGWQPAAH